MTQHPQGDYDIPSWAFDLNPFRTIPKVADFLYRLSPQHVTGDIFVDLSEAQRMAFMHLGEHLLLEMGILPPDWKYVYDKDCEQRPS